METTVIDKDFETKYTRWLELESSNPKPEQKELEEPVQSVMQEEEIGQIAQLAKSLGAKGYEFKLILEPRNSFNKLLVAKEYYPGPFKISAYTDLLKPLELVTYNNFGEIYSAIGKWRTGIHAKYNVKNLLIYKCNGYYRLGFRCHKCDSFCSKKNEMGTEIDNPDRSDDIPDISQIHWINSSIYCSSCQNAGLTDKERMFRYDVERSMCARVNEKHLSLDYSSGGSISQIHTVGRISPVKL
jgi:hypothetical protein